MQILVICANAQISRLSHNLCQRWFYSTNGFKDSSFPPLISESQGTLGQNYQNSLVHRIKENRLSISIIALIRKMVLTFEKLTILFSWSLVKVPLYLENASFCTILIEGL